MKSLSWVRRLYGNVKEFHQDLFESPYQTLTVTVNCEGAMGAGIAKVFRERVPGLYRWYREECLSGRFTPDRLAVYPWDDRQVLLFPTKILWRNPSPLMLVEWNLKTLRDEYRALGIESLGIVPLGCNNGKLLYEEEVRDRMFEYLSEMDIEVGIYLGR